MGQITSAVDDWEVIEHFRNTLAPYVIETQLSPGFVSSVSPLPFLRISTSLRETTTNIEKANTFLDRFTDVMAKGLCGLPEEKVC